ncbi:hypothetical protein ACIQCD_28020 [Streptomyces sp. NPDC093250]|uniref:hypothetical protein n=1 Tax=unclassified Streptomyces TaxID=2593676 RepID=UPI00343A1296
MDELKWVADVLASMNESERQQALRTIDGPPRMEEQEVPQLRVPLPTAVYVTRLKITTRIVPSA